jgi:hypothetical protein
MQAERTYNVNVIAQDVLMTPAEIKKRLPITPQAEEFVLQSRATLQRIIDRQDPRLFIVVGPCSIHDLRAARDYAQRLKQLAAEVADTLFIVMRVYFEKPRTSIGWKGLINDPYMDDSFRIEDGLQMARGVLLELAEMGVPAGTEALDPISAVHLRSHLLVCHWRPDDRVSDAPRDGERPLRSCWVQKQYGWQSRRGDQCHALGLPATQLPRDQPRWAVRHHPYQRQSLWPCCLARWRWQAQLRFCDGRTV